MITNPCMVYLNSVNLSVIALRSSNCLRLTVTINHFSMTSLNFPSLVISAVYYENSNTTQQA
jgi:hypothetical protein